MNAVADVVAGKSESWIHKNGVTILRTENNRFGIVVPNQRTPRVLCVEVDYLGRCYKRDLFNCIMPYRDQLDVNLDECMIRVKEGETVLAELGAQPQGHLYQPWMVVQGEQGHVTENYISVPPALHLTDSAGQRWTFGFITAEKEQSPQGEFAFEVLRDGIGMGEIASRLELRNGVVRVFTRHGWKRWLGREWS